MFLEILVSITGLHHSFFYAFRFHCVPQLKLTSLKMELNQLWVNRNKQKTMASTQAEVEAPRNGPEMKDLDGPNTNGVDAQREMETNSSNGPTSTPVSNNGSHDMNESSKLQSGGGYYKPPVGYPVDSPAAGYENAQSGFGYPPHSYIHQQQQQGDLQQQGSYPYPQYPGSNLVRNVSSPVLATKPVAYMNSMPRPGVGPVPSYPPVHHGSGAAGGQGYPPSRYSTPTLNQLLQPGTGGPVQRYSYGDYPQQQPPPPPNSHPAAGWPMQQQQPRNFAPGFKPPPNSMQQVQDDNVKVKPNFLRKNFLYWKNAVHVASYSPSIL